MSLHITNLQMEDIKIPIVRGSIDDVGDEGVRPGIREKGSAESSFFFSGK